MRQAPQKDVVRTSDVIPPAGCEFTDEELVAVIKELKPICEKERGHLLQWYYDLGKRVSKHYDTIAQARAEQQLTMYRANFFDQLAGRLKTLPASLLRQCCNLAWAYDAEAFTELSKAPAITASHALQLADIDDREVREDLQKRVIKDRLTVAELIKAIKERYGARRSPGAGRPCKVPKNANAAITHLTAQTEKFLRTNEVWFGDRFDIANALKEIPADRLTNDLKESLANAADLCDQLSKGL